MKKRYGAEIQETVRGFKARTVEVIRHRLWREHFKHKGDEENYGVQRFYPYDFTVKWEGRKEQRIEVKASRKENGLTGFYSSQEFSVMKDAEQNSSSLKYIVFHLRNGECADSTRYRWKKIKDTKDITPSVLPFNAQSQEKKIEIHVTIKASLSFENFPDFNPDDEIQKEKRKAQPFGNQTPGSAKESSP